MEKVGRKFSSFEEAEDADYQTYIDMTPEERLVVALQLYWMNHDFNDPACHKLERTVKIVHFSELAGMNAPL